MKFFCDLVPSQPRVCPWEAQIWLKTEFRLPKCCSPAFLTKRRFWGDIFGGAPAQPRHPPCSGSCAVPLASGMLFSLIFSGNKTCRLCIHCPFLCPRRRGGREKRKKKNPTQIFSCNKRLRVNLDRPLCSVSGQISRVFSGEIKTLELSLFSRRTNRSGSHFLPLINKTSPTSPGETLPGDFPS